MNNNALEYKRQSEMPEDIAVIAHIVFDTNDVFHTSALLIKKLDWIDTLSLFCRKVTIKN